MLARLKKEFRENTILVETFGVFIVIAFVLLAGEFTVFAVQQRMGIDQIPFHYPKTFLDNLVPFVPQFAWPYWSYYAFLGVSIWLPRNRSDLARLATGHLLIHLSGFVIFLLYPTAIIHPALHCHSLSCDMVGTLYMLDPGYGVFPSLHVAATTYVILTCFQFQFRWRWLVAIYGVSIMLATVFIKQHYVIDVPAGILFGLGLGRGSWYIADWLSAKRVLARA